MLDFEDFKHIAGILQMMKPDQERDEHLLGMYNTYIESSETREILEKDFKKKLKSTIFKLNKFMEEVEE